jgi:pimeloyl-ACP methyl ester carboxylesterase
LNDGFGYFHGAAFDPATGAHGGKNLKNGRGPARRRWLIAGVYRFPHLGWRFRRNSVGVIVWLFVHFAGFFMVKVPEILTRNDGAAIAYCRTPGKPPGVVFLTGFKSDMTGGKALALEEFCRRRGQAYLRFDYFGHGQSSGAFEDGTIGRWAEDAILVLDELCEDPQVLVGSSLGGWIMLLAALARPERVSGLIGTAAAPDFTEDLIESQLSAEQKQQLASQGFAEILNDYDDKPYKITQAFLDEGRNHLLLDGEIPLDCPVRLIHGTDDRDVPWQTSERIAEKLRSGDVETLFVQNGDHRLSEPPDLERLCLTVGRLLDHLEQSP